MLSNTVVAGTPSQALTSQPCINQDLPQRVCRLDPATIKKKRHPQLLTHMLENRPRKHRIFRLHIGNKLTTLRKESSPLPDRLLVIFQQYERSCTSDQIKTPHTLQKELQALQIRNVMIDELYSQRIRLSLRLATVCMPLLTSMPVTVPWDPTSCLVRRATRSGPQAGSSTC